MCRWIAYTGAPIFLDEVVSAPRNSLVAQSLHAGEAAAATNGDGFGVGWYGERETPGLYREVRPAWSDENLRHLCAQVRARLFCAHVRASTGTAVARSNCHPFVHGRHMFVHNGQIGNYHAVRRRIEALIPDDLYAARLGSTDSEAIFLAALGEGLAADPVRAIGSTLAAVWSEMQKGGADEPLRFTAAFTDGRDLHAFRWASDGKPPSLYYRESETALVVASERLDDAAEGWHQVPSGGFLIARQGRGAVPGCLDTVVKAARGTAKARAAPSAHREKFAAGPALAGRRPTSFDAALVIR